jgi:hypothetical protein
VLLSSYGKTIKKMGPSLAKAETSPFFKSGNTSNRFLRLGHSNSALGANFNAGLTAKTFVHIYRISLTIYHLKNLCRTGVYTFFITGTFVCIDFDYPHN